MSDEIRKEALQGLKEGAKHFDALREKWPKAFPKKSHEVLPLAAATVKTVAEGMGWKYHYAKSVLRVWKGRDPYCWAVLRHKKRFAIDGAETDEIIDDRARELARQVIENRKKRNERDAAKRQQREKLAQSAA